MLNLNPSIWGPSGWFFLDTILYSLEKDESPQNLTNVVNFFYSIKDILPCQSCRDNYVLFLQNNPLKCVNKEDLIQWFIKCHNEVNNGSITYETWLNYYDRAYEKSNKVFLLRNIFIISAICLFTITFKIWRSKIKI
ncbi:putative Evr1/Alr family thiol oxidoreductase [Namao virus]|nr:putative Evr1/Alr family thiol oxidoreductase [Namao virus]